MKFLLIITPIIALICSFYVAPKTHSYVNQMQFIDTLHIMEKLIYGHFKHIFCIKKNVFKNIFHNIVENHFYIKFGIKNSNLFEIKTKIFLRLFKVPVSSTEHNI